MSRKAVKRAKSVPRPKQSGLIRQTVEWTAAVRQMDVGKQIEILPPTSTPSLSSPINAFMAALKRKYRRSYHIYAVKGVIYAVPKNGT
jgi:hypothetical protein